MKRIIALSSCFHSNTLTIGYSTNSSAIWILHFTLQHSIASASLFAFVGLIYDSIDSRDSISLFSSLSRSSNLSFGLLLGVLFSCNFPPSSGFYGEISLLSILYSFYSYFTFILLLCLSFKCILLFYFWQRITSGYSISISLLFISGPIAGR